MRDRQVVAFLQEWSGFSRGMISSDKPNESVGLSEILEPMAESRYFLSPRACQGILRRAERRGRPLPELLLLNLQAVAMEEATQRRDT